MPRGKAQKGKKSLKGDDMSEDDEDKDGEGEQWSVHAGCFSFM